MEVNLFTLPLGLQDWERLFCSVIKRHIQGLSPFVAGGSVGRLTCFQGGSCCERGLAAVAVECLSLGSWGSRQTGKDDLGPPPRGCFDLDFPRTNRIK